MATVNSVLSIRKLKAMQLQSLFCGLLVACAVQPEVEGTTVQVYLDTANAPTRSLTGILHGGNNASPPTDLITPLGISQWRNRDVLMYPRINELGAVDMFILLSGWGGGTANGYPYDNPTGWVSAVSSVATSTVGQNFFWDGWNEPDWPGRWAGTEQQLADTYALSYKTIKTIKPNDKIGGPSISKYDLTRITNFLNYALQNGVQVNFVSWHELNNDSNIPSIKKHVDEIRKNFIDNPVYAALNIQGVSINEYVGQGSQYSPGDILGYLYYLELSRVEYASKSCWPGFAGPSNCNNFTLGGLITPNTFLPRSSWWAFKLYADGWKTRVLSTSTDQFVNGLANTTSTGAQVLVAVYGKADVTKVCKLKLNKISFLPGFSSDSLVKIDVKKLPNSLEAPLDVPVSVQSYEVRAANDSLTLTLPTLSLHEAYIVTISKGN